MDLSVVFPCYNTRESLFELVKRTIEALQVMPVSYELIFVDDYSPQLDYILITDLAAKDDRIKLILFSRNFGQQAAITAGLSKTKGDWVVVMDADLQDDPKYITELFNKAHEGYDIVFTKALNRKDGLLKKAFSDAFYTLFSFLTGSPVNRGLRNYGIYSRKAINTFLALKEQFRGFALLMRWVGFRSTTIEIEYRQRKIGKTSYSFLKSINLALDSFIAFSDRPLKSTMVFGLFISTSALIAGLVFFIRAILGYSVLVGWTSLILSIWFMGGFTVFFIGLIGLYVGKVFNEAKGRPHYIIDKTINIDE